MHSLRLPAVDVPPVSKESPRLTFGAKTALLYPQKANTPPDLRQTGPQSLGLSIPLREHAERGLNVSNAFIVLSFKPPLATG